MKKNKMIRTASGLLVATLLTTSIISGTFAKYVTTASGGDSARVAKWGFTEDGTTIELNKLFKDAYDTTVNSETVDGKKADVIAPGTAGSAQFGFKYDGTYDGTNKLKAPEVAYTFHVSTEGSSCAEDIQNNANIQWKLDGDADSEEGWGNWSTLISSIEALDGNKDQDKYAPNELPTAFNTSGDNIHTVYWRWKFSTGDEADKKDTTMGNKTTLDDVTLKISVTATQID